MLEFVCWAIAMCVTWLAWRRWLRVDDDWKRRLIQELFDEEEPH